MAEIQNAFSQHSFFYPISVHTCIDTVYSSKVAAPTQIESTLFRDLIIVARSLASTCDGEINEERELKTRKLHCRNTCADSFSNNIVDQFLLEMVKVDFSLCFVRLTLSMFGCVFHANLWKHAVQCGCGVYLQKAAFILSQYITFSSVSRSFNITLPKYGNISQQPNVYVCVRALCFEQKIHTTENDCNVTSVCSALALALFLCFSCSLAQYLSLPLLVELSNKNRFIRASVI